MRHVLEGADNPFGEPHCGSCGLPYQLTGEDAWLHAGYCLECRPAPGCQHLGELELRVMRGKVPPALLGGVENPDPVVRLVCRDGVHYGTVGDTVWFVRRCPGSVQLPETSFTFTSFRPTGAPHAYKVCTEFAAQDEGSLILRGCSRLGKTHLAYAIAHRLRERQKTVAVSTAAALHETFKHLSANSFEAADKLGEIHKADLFVLDDLGGEYASSDYFKLKLRELWDHLIQNRIRWVITTNLTEKQLVNQYTDPVYQRMMSGTTVVEFRKKE